MIKKYLPWIKQVEDSLPNQNDIDVTMDVFESTELDFFVGLERNEIKVWINKDKTPDNEFINKFKLFFSRDGRAKEIHLKNISDPILSRMIKLNLKLSDYTYDFDDKIFLRSRRPLLILSFTKIQ